MLLGNEVKFSEIFLVTYLLDLKIKSFLFVVVFFVYNLIEKLLLHSKVSEKKSAYEYDLTSRHLVRIING